MRTYSIDDTTVKIAPAPTQNPNAYMLSAYTPSALKYDIIIKERVRYRHYITGATCRTGLLLFVRVFQRLWLAPADMVAS